MTALPTGTVTFLFTDVEGSTRLWEEHPEAMKAALARHDEILRGAVEHHDGYIVKTTGDGLHAAFALAPSAVLAAVEAQLALADEPSALPARLRVRMGLHTGSAEARAGDYYGPTVNRAARIAAAAHGGQIIGSAATTDLVRDDLAAEIELTDLGEHRLRDLDRPERITQFGGPGLQHEFSPLRSLDARSTNLPAQLTSFVGRTAEVHGIEELLAEQRIVTLTGVGGVGKTRLALEVAADTVEQFDDGTWFVDLASVDAGRVVAVIAGELGIDVEARRGLEESLVDMLRARELLVVLDNCEHIVREVRRITELILREAPRVRILVTSREGLRVSGEQLFSVPSLDDESAADLFVERARAVEPTFSVDGAGTEAVAALCERLDGMPLAIELAAARISMFSLDELAGRLDQRFRLLTGGRATVERHQTLRAAIDWSYDLLTEAERMALARMSVFAGGCTLAAAEAVLAGSVLPSDDVLDLLGGLVDKSLVIVDRSHSETRYDMLETVRQYAEERLVDLGEAEATRARHVAWYSAFARAAGRGLYSREEAVWLERLRTEIDNLGVAVVWAVGAGDTDAAMRIAASFPRQGTARPLLGTSHLAEQALPVRGFDQHPLRARVLAEAGWAAVKRGDRSTAMRLLEASIAAQRHGARYAAAAFTYLLGLSGWTEDLYLRGYEISLEGLAMAEAAGDEMGANGMRTACAVHAMMVGRDDEAREHAARALADARALGQPTLEAAAVYANAVSLARADPGKAIELCHEALELTRQLENESEQYVALGLLTALEARHGDARRSLEAMRAQLSGAIFPGVIGEQRFYVGIEAFNRVGRPDLVARCDGFCQAGDIVGSAFYAGFHDDAIAAARASIGADAYKRHLAEGAAMPADRFGRVLIEEVDRVLAELDVSA